VALNTILTKYGYYDMSFHVILSLLYIVDLCKCYALSVYL